MQVHDRVPDERGRLFVGRAAAKSRHALHRHAVGVGRLGGDRDDDRQPVVELVAPLNRHGLPRSASIVGPGTRPVVAPDRGLGQVAMKAMRPAPDTHDQPAAALARDQAPRHRQGVDERHQRCAQRAGHFTGVDPRPGSFSPSYRSVSIRA